MFGFTAKPTVTWPTTVRTPQDGGTIKETTFDGIYEVIPQDKLSDTLASGLPERVLVGWGDDVPAAEAGKFVPFSQAAKAELLSLTYARVGVTEAYMQLAQGRAAPEKN